MKPGKLALLRFPYADHRGAKLRPVLLITQLPGFDGPQPSPQSPISKDFC